MSRRLARRAGIALAAWALHAAALAAGNAAQGQQLYEQRCVGCHSVDAHRVGPAHRGVFGRKAGSASGFAYSAAVSKSALVWNEKTLDAWLADPEKLIPGQVMNYRVDATQDRADLVAYLRSLAP